MSFSNHVSIEPIKAYVTTALLHDGEGSGFTECKIIGFSLYLNEAVCADIVLNDGSMFSYIPIHLLVTSPSSELKYDLNDIVYHNCNGFDVSISVIDYLKNSKNLCYLKYKDEWLGCQYLMTLDWYNGNDLLHFITLDNGQFALMPNHKLKFGNDERRFVPYKKLRGTWRV